MRDIYVRLEIAERGAHNFFAKVEHESLGTVQYSLLRSSGQRATRTPAAIRREPAERFFVILQAEGTGVVCQDGREVALPAGAWTIIDSTRPYDLMFDTSFAQVVLAVPRDQLPCLRACSARATAVDLCSVLQLGPLLALQLRHLGGRVTGLPVGARISLGDSMLSLIAASMEEVAGRAGSHVSRHAACLRRIKSVIARRIKDPQLDVASIASELLISPRYVHKVFGSEGVTVSAYIRSVRLDSCRRELLDEPGTAVAQVARSWGFRSATHFSTVFRRRFGVSPRAARRTHGPAMPSCVRDRL